MKSFFNSRSIGFVLMATVLLAFTGTYADANDRRTDGPPGSEYADFSRWEGNMQMGAQFGALLSTRGDSDASFALGVDADFRPYKMFGLRATYMQGLTTPRSSLIGLTPLVHTRYSNLTPYALFGPGVAITNFGDTKVRFAITGGVGADVWVTQRFGLGMLWVYNSLIGSSDLHTLSARLSYMF